MSGRTAPEQTTFFPVSVPAVFAVEIAELRKIRETNELPNDLCSLFLFCHFDIVVCVKFLHGHRAFLFHYNLNLWVKLSGHIIRDFNS